MPAGDLVDDILDGRRAQQAPHRHQRLRLLRRPRYPRGRVRHLHRLRERDRLRLGKDPGEGDGWDGFAYGEVRGCGGDEIVPQVQNMFRANQTRMEGRPEEDGRIQNQIMWHFEGTIRPERLFHTEGPVLKSGHDRSFFFLQRVSSYRCTREERLVHLMFCIGFEDAPSTKK